MHRIRRKNLFLVVFLVICHIPLFMGPTVNAQEQSDDWPMFRHDPAHTGYTDTSVPRQLSIIWSSNIGKGTSSSPSIVDGRVYIGSYDDNFGYTNCLDAIDGSLIWRYQTDDQVLTSPAVVSDRVYMGSHDDYVYCLGANNGSLIWGYQAGDIVGSHPIVANEKVYVGSWDYNVYCLNASNGEEIWNFTSNPVLSSPAVAYDRVYVGTLNGDVYCLNASDGTLIWNHTVGVGILSSPAVAYGKVYIGSYYYPVPGYPLVGYVGCLDAYNGNLIWDYAKDGFISTSPAVADGRVYICTENGAESDSGRISCLNATDGSLIWEYMADGCYEFSSPSLAEGKLYVGYHYACWFFDDSRGPSYVYCLDAGSGGKISHCMISDSAVSSPVIVNGRIYVGSGGSVYCVSGVEWGGNDVLLFLIAGIGTVGLIGVAFFIKSRFSEA